MPALFHLLQNFVVEPFRREHRGCHEAGSVASATYESLALTHREEYTPSIAYCDTSRGPPVHGRQLHALHNHFQHRLCNNTGCRGHCKLLDPAVYPYECQIWALTQDG